MKLKRLAIIGARGHYDRILRSLAHLPEVRVVATCRAGGESMQPIEEWCRRRGHASEIFDDHHAVLRQARPDAVVICGPLERHAEMAIDAIRAGVHVLIEKPAAMSLDELEQLQQVHAEHPDVRLAVMMIARYQPSFYTAWRLVREGAIGDVRMINARKSYKLGERTGFFRRRESYGGTIPWVGSHAIDWMLWIGGHRVRSAYATHTASGKAPQGTMEQSALCHFTLCGDRYASISIDLFRPSSARTHGDDWLRLAGTEGVIEVTSDAVKMVNAENDGTIAVPLDSPPTILEDFAAHVEGRPDALMDAADTFATTATCLLARQSADEGRPLDAEAFSSIPMKSRRHPAIVVNGVHSDAFPMTV